MKDNFFQKKVAIITGSGQGIGKAVAKELLLRGAKVVLNARDTDRLNATLNELSAYGEVMAFPADVTQPDQVKQMVDACIDRYGKLDILINNAGLSMKGDLADLEPDAFKQVMDANVLGKVIPTRYALPEIRKQKGSIVFISSVAGIRGLAGYSAYCASKMALRAVTETLRVEEANTGVHAGLVYVGFTRNDAAKRTLNSKGELVKIDDRARFKPMEPEVVANAILKNIESRRFITTLTRLGKLNRFMQTWFPALTERLLIRMTAKE